MIAARPRRLFFDARFIPLPALGSFDSLYAYLRTQDFTIYAGQQHLFDEVFRIAVMGHLSEADFAQLVDVFPLADISEPVEHGWGTP